MVEAGDGHAVEDAGVLAVFELFDEIGREGVEDLEQFGDAFPDITICNNYY